MLSKKDRAGLFCAVALVVLCFAPVVTQAGFMDDFVKGLQKGAKVTIAPALTTLSPAEVQEAVPFTLQLKGANFNEQSKVFVQVLGQIEGQLNWLEFSPYFVSSSELSLAFDKGFSANPSVRAIYVANPDGAKSQQLPLRIVAGQAVDGDGGYAVPQQSAADMAPAQSSGAALVLGALAPAEIGEGEPFVLRITGKGFSENSSVFIEVNRNAGQPDLAPEYDFIAFTPIFINGQELEIDFTMGFGANPPARQIYVTDTDGNRSNTLTLTILPAP